MDVYVVDTGIETSHADFGGRAVWGVTTATGSADRDGNGHGTHVAGTAGATGHGVAKRTRLVAVKALNDIGLGSIDDILAGLQWVLDAHASGGNFSVALLAFGSSGSLSIDAAVAELVQGGVVVVTTAGGSVSCWFCLLVLAKRPL